MVGGLLLRGMLAGLIAGLLAFGLAWVLGEPQLERAIAFEQQLTGGGHSHGGAGADDHASGHEEDAIVGRAMQSTVGLLTGLAVYAIGLGGLFSFVFAYAFGRVGSIEPRPLAALLAAAAFLALSLVSSLKYPANPPAIGLGETIGYRTGLFFTMIVFSVAALTATLVLLRALAARLGCWNGAIVAGALLIAVVAVGQAFLPEVDEIPVNFPAAVLWRFRIASLATHALLWAAIGLVFGSLAERFLQGSKRERRVALSPQR